MPEKLARPKVPGVPLRRRSFEQKGRSLTPLAGPDIPIPGDQDEQLRLEFESWHAVYNGSLPEYIVWKWLIEKKLEPGVDFLFQSPFFGGRTRFGGYIADFVFPMRREIWQVQGLRWHLRETTTRANDAIAKMLLTGRGYKVIELWEDDLLVRPDFVLNLAWERSSEVPTRRP